MLAIYDVVDVAQSVDCRRASTGPRSVRSIAPGDQGLGNKRTAVVDVLEAPAQEAPAAGGTWNKVADRRNGVTRYRRNPRKIEYVGARGHRRRCLQLEAAASGLGI